MQSYKQNPESSLTPTPPITTNPPFTPSQPNIPPLTPSEPILNTQQIQVQPPVEDAQNFTAVPSEKQIKAFKKLKVLFVLLATLLLLSVMVILSYLVTYDKIRINNDTYKKFQGTFSKRVLSLPFTPKTPEYVLAKAIDNQRNVTSHSFNLSVALDSFELSQLLGTDKLDIETKGNVDYSNQDNILFDFNTSITKDINFDLMKIGNLLYFKVNKFYSPILFSALLGTSGEDESPFNSVVDKWVSYDISTLSTQARESLNENNKQESYTKMVADEFLEIIADPKIKSQLKIEEVKINNIKMYKILLNPNSEAVNIIIDKLEHPDSTEKSQNNTNYSEYFSNFSAEVFVDKGRFTASKMALSFDVSTNSKKVSSIPFLTPDLNKTSIAMVLELGNINRKFNFTAPENTISVEEFVQAIMPESNILNTSLQFPKSRDTKRLSDLMALLTALELYRLDNNKYPNTLSDLVPEYMAMVPMDPNGGNYFYRVINDGYNLCANLETTDYSASGSSIPCPNSSYNFHLTKPLKE